MNLHVNFIMRSNTTHSSLKKKSKLINFETFENIAIGLAYIILTRRCLAFPILFGIFVGRTVNLNNQC